jgi:hypothetical protein
MDTPGFGNATVEVVADALKMPDGGRKGWTTTWTYAGESQPSG